jgi:CubicO group peptidase (beta-lactamase class C family)
VCALPTPGQFEVLCIFWSIYMKSTAAVLLALLSAEAAAQCDAWYRFDGDLSDANGGVNGEMIGAGGAAATARFTDGVDGQALVLDGTSAMRTFLYLHPDSCRQFTFSGWLRMDPSVSDTQWLLGTGGGSRPGLRSDGVGATLDGSGNGLSERGAIRDPRVWFFFAGVYDYAAGTYRFHWRERSVEGFLPEAPGPFADAFWIGALNEELHYAVRNAALDELRIVGRALSEAEIAALRGGRPSAYLPASGPAVAGGPAGGSSVMPRPVEGLSDRLSPVDPVVNAEDFADRRNTPPLLPGDIAGTASTSDDDIRIELAEGAGSGRDATGSPAPVLTPLGGQPGLEAREALEAASETEPTIEKVDLIECDSPGDPTWTIFTNTGFPQPFMNALVASARCGLAPRVIVINDNDQWVVGAGDQVARSTNLPGEMARTLDDYEDSRGGIDAADITARGEWLVASGNQFAESDIPDAARTRAQAIVGSNGRIVSFTISPANASRWLMVDDDGSVYGDSDRPRAILAESGNFQASQQGGTQARYMPNGSWLLLERDGRFISDGLPDETIDMLDGLRRSGASLDHVLTYKVSSGYLMVSGGALAARPTDPIYQVENNIGGGTIWSRLVANNITGAQIAVVRNNQIAWTRGYGVRLASDPESYVMADTTFDFASVSKPIASFSLMQLDETDRLDVTRTGGLEDITTIIPRGQRREFRNEVRPEAGTIAQVMQQCAGFCYGFARDCQSGGSQGGAREYGVNQALPSTAEVIMGRSPAASSHRVVRTANFGVMFRYTSANYILIQALVDVHGGGFVNHTNKLFSDLDMVASTYESPYPKFYDGNFARGHERGVLQGRAAYGELAAASLVSTTADVARFVIALNQDGANVLSRNSVDRYLGRSPVPTTYCSNPGTMALGMNRRASDGNWGNNETFWHNGDHNGYHAKMIGLPGLQTGFVAVMTSDGDDANDFWAELSASLRSAYGL